MEGQIIVTRIGEKLSPVGEVVERVKALSVADRLKVFESFELCCGMNRGACVCPQPSGAGWSKQLVPLAVMTKAEKIAELANFQADNLPTLQDEWLFTKDAPQFADDGNIYRLQKLAPDFKRSRKVQVDEDNHDKILRVL